VRSLVDDPPVQIARHANAALQAATSPIDSVMARATTIRLMPAHDASDTAHELHSVTPREWVLPAILERLIQDLFGPPYTH
jgi:hypothetical protein